MCPLQVLHLPDDNDMGAEKLKKKQHGSQCSAGTNVMLVFFPHCCVWRLRKGVIQLDLMLAGSQQTAESAQAAWLGSVPDGVKQVMLAMQQMASVAVQSSVQRDPCHDELVQSLSPDALLACGECSNHAWMSSCSAAVLSKAAICFIDDRLPVQMTRHRC